MRDLQRLKKVDPHDHLWDLERNLYPWLFGPARCMFASNVPPDALRKSYDEIYAAFYVWAQRYDESECHSMFHDTAARFYRLGTD